MLAASFNELNAEFGFSLSLTPPPDLQRYLHELDMIEHNYVQYLGLTQAHSPVAAEVHGAVSPHAGVEAARRLRERERRARAVEQDRVVAGRFAAARARRGFKRRREALERIQSAAGELEQRIGEFEAQDARLQQFQSNVGALLQSLRHPQNLQELPELDMPVLHVNVGSTESKRVPIHA